MTLISIADNTPVIARRPRRRGNPVARMLSALAERLRRDGAVFLAEAQADRGYQFAGELGWVAFLLYLLQRLVCQEAFCGVMQNGYRYATKRFGFYHLSHFLSTHTTFRY